MKIPDFLNFAKKLIDYIPRRDIEKFVFKVLFVLWLFFVAAVIILSGTLDGRRSDIDKIMGAGSGMRPLSDLKSELERYEALLELTKYPEDVQGYVQCLRRDPFSEYKETAIIIPGAEYDFVLKSVVHLPLPMVYKGYIELPDKIIGQINWLDSTRFAEVGSRLNGYRIKAISKNEIEAVDRKGKEIIFKLGKPVLGDELQAVLYDNISGRTFTVAPASEIADYKVIDIAPDYVILVSNGEEIKLKK